MDDGPLYLTKRISFVAAHQLRRAEWSDAKNTEVFGKCFREHGHDYVVEVTVKGPVHREDGMVINLGDLKTWLQEEIHDPCDHHHLNKDVPFMAGILPTVENLSLEFWKRVSRRLGGRGELYRIRVWESPNNSCEYYGAGGR